MSENASATVVALSPEQRRVEIACLYQEAFDRFGTIALWNLRRHEHPTPGDALAITRQLRVEGNMAARFLAERIEARCRAAD